MVQQQITSKTNIEHRSKRERRGTDLRLLSKRRNFLSFVHRQWQRTSSISFSFCQFTCRSAKRHEFRPRREEKKNRIDNRGRERRDEPMDEATSLFQSGLQMIFSIFNERHLFQRTSRSCLVALAVHDDNRDIK